MTGLLLLAAHYSRWVRAFAQRHRLKLWLVEGLTLAMAMLAAFAVTVALHLLLH